MHKVLRNFKINWLGTAGYITLVIGFFKKLKLFCSVFKLFLLAFKD